MLYYYIYSTSMLSFGDCLQEPKPILRYALVEYLNVWINEEWGNLELYHIKNNARVDVSKYGHFETPTTKTDIVTSTFLLFSNIKGFLLEQLTSDYLST